MSGTHRTEDGDGLSDRERGGEWGVRRSRCTLVNELVCLGKERNPYTIMDNRDGSYVNGDRSVLTKEE